MKTDHKFNPRDNNERMILKAIENGAQILCDTLGVDITLRVERMNGWARADAFHQGKWVPEGNLVKINMRNLHGASLDYVLEVLGHEFRHAVQTQHSVCDDVPSERLHPALGTRPTSHGRFSSYWNLPKERDARKYQKAYRDIVVNHGGFVYRDRLTETVPGKPLRIPDRPASIARLGRPAQFIGIFKDLDKKRYWFDYREVNGASEICLVNRRKLWTRAVCNKVWGEHREQLIKQPFEIVYREATMDDMVY